MRRMGPIARLLLLVLLSSLAWSSSAAGAPDVPESRAPEGTPLVDFLAGDGTLVIPDDFEGSIDPAGFQLISGDGEAPRFAPQGAGPRAGVDDANWDMRFHESGLNEEVKALLWNGRHLYAGGYFTSGANKDMANIARWDGRTWQALGSGVNSGVWALAWDGTSLFAAGDFTEAGGVMANHVARWNGTSWSALGSGIDSRVYALAWDGTGLFAGGTFSSAGGTAAANIAYWNGSSWSDVGAGVNDLVYTLAWDGSLLYAGGQFSQAGGAPANNIAYWDGVIWQQPAGGVNGTVDALLSTAGNLYVGGDFSAAGGSPAANLARWDGTSWSDVAGGTDGRVYALAWEQETLLVGGDFATAGGLSSRYLARWDSAGWHDMGTNLDSKSAGKVNSLAGDGRTLYVGGFFASVGNGTINSQNIMRWDLDGWTNPGAAGANGTVHSLLWTGGQLVAAGSFLNIGGQAANRVAAWDGTAWQPLAGGLGGPVYALAWDGSTLYAGGQFLNAGAGISYIAAWDGTSWTGVGGGMNNVVRALAWDGTYLYAGGDFTTADGNGAARLARWDGSAWTQVGGGVNNTVYALAEDGTNLYVGGSFTATGGVGIFYLARWNGASWTALGTGVNATVYTLLWQGSSLYAGGILTTAGGVQVNRVARWDGTDWSALAQGLDGFVRALAWFDGYLVAAGDFDAIKGAVAGADRPANYLARFDGTQWQSLGFGSNLSANALATGADGLFIGGQFTAVSGRAAERIVRYDGGRWQALGAGSGLFNGSAQSGVYDLGWFGGSLYIGGAFDQAGAMPASSNVARWDGRSWHSLGAGLNGTVRALAWDGSQLYAATTNALIQGQVYQWDGVSWSSLGGQFDGVIYDLAWDGSGLYAGGWFDNVGGTPASSVARWNGVGWSAVGSGLSNAGGTGGTVYALVWEDGSSRLYAGGDFSESGGSPMAGVAVWNGMSWSAVGGGLATSRVNALLWQGSMLYAAGWYYGLPTNYGFVTRWDGTSWLEFGLTSGTEVLALASDGAQLYAGGNFTQVNGTSANRVARWDGSDWWALGSGLDGPLSSTKAVFDLTWDGDSAVKGLYVGGEFWQAGGRDSFNVAHWRAAAVWDGGGTDNNGSTAANWSGDVAPEPGDVLVFDGHSPKQAVLDSGLPSNLGGLVVETGYHGQVVVNRALALTGDLQQYHGSLTLPDPAVAQVTVDGAVIHAGGSLIQSQAVNGTNETFLLIQDAAGLTTKYRGLEVQAAGSGSNLGQVTAVIGAVDVTTGEYCTTDGPRSYIYTDRCYRVTPANDGPAALRLYGRDDELNGLQRGSLGLFRYAGLGVWERILGGAPVNLGDGYWYVQANVPGFSAFLVALNNQAPTAIELQSVKLRTDYGLPGVLLAAFAGLLLATVGLWLRALRIKGTGR